MIQKEGSIMLSQMKKLRKDGVRKNAVIIIAMMVADVMMIAIVVAMFQKRKTQPENPLLPTIM